MVILPKSFPRFLTSISTAAVCGLFFAGTSSAQAADWKNDVTGLWFESENWWGGAVPTAGQNASIDNNGSAFVQFNDGVPAEAAIVNVGIQNKGTLTIDSDGGLLATSATIGNSAGAEGTVLVFGEESYLSLTGDLMVGQGGKGTLNIYTGAAVTSAQGFLGYGGTAEAAVQVTGAGSTWTLQSYFFVAYWGKAVLDITEGGRVETAAASALPSTMSIGHQQGSDGTVNVNGIGSALVIKDDLNIGAQGKGHLDVSSQGTVTNAYGNIGNEESGTGSVTVNGEGSTWTSTNDLSVGKAGSGQLTVINGGLVESDSGYVGFATTGQGEATITGEGSRWENSSALHVGYEGTGTLHITSGGVVTSTDGFVGERSGTAEARGGTVNLSGENSAWEMSGDLAVGGSGAGVVNITAGSSVESTDAGLGVAAAGNGEVNVLGGETLWTTRGALTVGDAGEGKVNITTGAAAVANTATIGKAATGTGEVNVTGDDSLFQVTNAVVIGGEGEGKMNVTLGASATSASATLGESADSYGEVNVANDGTSWQVTGQLTIGNEGEGLVRMTGGSIGTGSTVLGSQEGSTGTATLESGTWTNLGEMTVGGLGEGIVNLKGNGVLRLGASGNGTLVLAESTDSTGTLNIGEGDTVGTLEAAGVSGGLGTAVVNFNHAGTVYFSPTLSGSLSITKSGNGLLVLDEAHTYTGDTSVNDGTLLISNTTGSATGSGDVAVGHLGRLIGDGSISGDVAINGIISPGNGDIATLSTGSQIWKNDGIYEWEIQNLDGDEGDGWDFLNIDGGLTLDSSAENPFTIMVKSLTLDGDEGLLFGFSDLQNYSWTILTVSTEIATWSLNQIVLDLNGFTNEYVGAFSLAQAGNSLNLIYTVPEPSTGILLALAMGLLGARRGRRGSRDA